jgi:hypothetical protein
MGEDRLTRHKSGKHAGPARTSPYPVSRLAPAHDLVDTARQIAEADNVIGTVVHSKLTVIADQIRALQERAREILEEAVDAAELHRAACNFPKKVGHIYHLYRRPAGSLYFSMLSPEDWGEPPHEYLDSYRLEADMSWTPASEAAPPTTAELRALVGMTGES